MTVIKLKISCRIEEVPTIGHFLLDSMNTDLVDFTAFSPDYDAGFITTANAELAAIEALINPLQLTAELKVITLTMYNNMNALRPKIDFLEGYIKRATGLTVGVSDFGIKAVRKANNDGDVEGLVGALSYTLQLVSIAANMTALTAKGYTAGQHTALVTLRGQLSANNTAQNAKINERNNKVVANYGMINTFWLKLTDIGDAGKLINKTANPDKVDDYTIAELKRRIRQEQLRTKFTGVTSSEGSPFAGAKIEMVPVLGGRRRTTTSKAGGGFEIKSITAAEYIVNVTATNKVPQSVGVVIVAGEELVMDFVLVSV